MTDKLSHKMLMVSNFVTELKCDEILKYSKVETVILNLTLTPNRNIGLSTV